MSGELRNIYNMTNRWVHAEIILEWFLQGVITQLFGSCISASSTLVKARTSMLCLMRKAIRVHKRMITCHMSPEIILREWKICSVCLCMSSRLIFLNPRKREDRDFHFMQHCCALFSSEIGFNSFSCPHRSQGMVGFERRGKMIYDVTVKQRVAVWAIS